MTDHGRRAHIRKMRSADTLLELAGQALEHDQADEAALEVAAAVGLFRELGDPLKLGRALQLQAFVAATRGRADGVVACMAEAAQAYRDGGDYEALLRIQLALLDLTGSADRSDTRREASVMLDWWRDHGDANLLAVCLQGLANSWANQGAWDEADQLLAEAEERSRPVGNRVALARILMTRGAVVIERHGQLTDAGHLFQEAATLLQGQGDAIGLSACYVVLEALNVRAPGQQSDRDGEGAPLDLVGCAQQLRTEALTAALTPDEGAQRNEEFIREVSRHWGITSTTRNQKPSQPDQAASGEREQRVSAAGGPHQLAESTVPAEEHWSPLELALNTLAPHERWVLRSHLGLDRSTRRRTLLDIAERFGTSRETAWDIEEDALAKLRRTPPLRQERDLLEFVETQLLLARMVDSFLDMENPEEALAWLHATPAADERFVDLLLDLILTEERPHRITDQRGIKIALLSRIAAVLVGTPRQQATSALLLALTHPFPLLLPDRQQETDLLFALARDTYRMLGDQQGEAAVLRAQAELAFHEGRQGTAAAFQMGAVELLGGVGARQELARALLDLGDMTYASSPQDAGTHYVDAAHVLEQQPGCERLRGDALVSAGDTAAALEQLDDAGKHYRDAAALFEEFGDDQRRAAIAWRQAELARHRGLFEQASEHSTAALALYRKLGDDGACARALVFQGDLALWRSLMDQAAPLYAEAARLYKRADDEKSYALTLLRLGGLALDWRHDAQAVAYVEQATAVFRALQDERGLAAILIMRGDVQTELARLGPAEARQYQAAAARDYKEAVEKFRMVGEYTGEVAALNQLGKLAFERHEFGEAMECFSRSVEVLREHGKTDLFPVGMLLLNLGHALLALDRPSDACVVLADALESNSIDGMAVFPMLSSQIHTIWARCHLAEKAWVEAWKHADDALELLRGISAHVRVAASRARLQDQTPAAYAVAVEAALALAGTAVDSQTARSWWLTAWRTAEEAKSAALLPLLGDDAVRATRLRPEERDAQTHDLLRALDRTEAAMSALLAAPSMAAGAGASIPTQVMLGSMQVREGDAGLRQRAVQLAALQRERTGLLKQLWEHHQRLGAVRGRVDVPLDAIQEVLQAQGAGLVSYACLSDGRFAGLVLRPEGDCREVRLDGVSNDDVHRTLLRPDGQGHFVHLFRFPYRLWTTAERRAFARLGEALWGPLEESGALADLAHVYVVPDGWLRLLPFAALAWTDGRGQVVDQHALTVLLAGSLLPHLAYAASRVRRPGQLATVLDPAHARADVEPLQPEAVAYLRARLGSRSRPLVGNVDRQRLARAINRHGGLLFLGHGTAEGLVVGDGTFTAYDALARLDARGPALLGACLLGYEHAFHGLEGSSTIGALHFAGCPAVLGALCEVPQVETAQLLADMAQGSPDWARCLQQAQLTLRQQDPDSLTWAAFTLYGLPSCG